ncbi:hypothetical protein KAH94_04450 [bacterium]|nr:hypothetical protein [bacterium]
MKIIFTGLFFLSVMFVPIHAMQKGANDTNCLTVLKRFINQKITQVKKTAKNVRDSFEPSEIVKRGYKPTVRITVDNKKDCFNDDLDDCDNYPCF